MLQQFKLVLASDLETQLLQDTIAVPAKVLKHFQVNADISQFYTGISQFYTDISQFYTDISQFYTDISVVVVCIYLDHICTQRVTHRHRLHTNPPLAVRYAMAVRCASDRGGGVVACFQFADRKNEGKIVGERASVSSL